jgi:hypothetical protein
MKLNLKFIFILFLSFFPFVYLETSLIFKTYQYSENDKPIIMLLYDEPEIKIFYNEKDEIHIEQEKLINHCEFTADVAGNKTYELDFALKGKKDCYKNFKLIDHSLISFEETIELQFCCKQTQNVNFKIVNKGPVKPNIKSLFYENDKKKIFPDTQSFFAKPYIVTETINVEVRLELKHHFCPIGYVEQSVLPENIRNALTADGLKACFKMHGIFWG